MKLPTIVACVLLAGCAIAPEKIPPAYVSEVLYQSWSCQQLGEEQMRLSEAISTASSQQRTARSNDIAGVILIGLPVSSLSGSNVAAEIARLKGEMQAVQKAGIRSNCGLPEPPPIPPEPPRPIPRPAGNPNSH